ncbi:hypothetical protein [Psychroflexus salis]|uniref:Uncharacterized protein n=1 Tax=Psychroflexus salis TaxID=1526574 RepID=A0A917A290_9FLAO|nr:hypothetical protein [Psychroflexus salis]GGE22917.1 hypothetical protein GCM10010831_24780 [Psychroflexus salis]
MFIIKEKMSFKKMMIVGLVIFGSIIAESKFDNYSTETVNEAGFLGWGSDNLEGPCYSPTGNDYDMIQLITPVYKVFGLIVSRGEPYYVSY